MGGLPPPAGTPARLVPIGTHTRVARLAPRSRAEVAEAVPKTNSPTPSRPFFFDRLLLHVPHDQRVGPLIDTDRSPLGQLRLHQGRDLLGTGVAHRNERRLQLALELPLVREVGPRLGLRRQALQRRDPHDAALL